MSTYTRDGLAEVIPLRPGQDSAPQSGDRDAERLAELDVEIREHFDRLRELITEKVQLEDGEAA